VTGRRAATLEGAPVSVRGIRLGEVQNVLLDEDAARILGLEVLCGDGSSRFLPLAPVTAKSGGLEIASTLTLLDGHELAFYRGRSRTLASVPALGDAIVGPAGTLIVPLEAHC
jgi:hypothetical protein